MSKSLFYFLNGDSVQQQIALNVSLEIGEVIALPINGESGTQKFLVKEIKQFSDPEAMSGADVKLPSDLNERHITHVIIEPAS